ncbi:MAG: NADH-quinone oxidoreductase subunit NuoE [Armatimonadota bacterium]|nr:NADH-quinone oxidoreductase subunit NuoE [Armatimonadota bacterium]MDR5702469.1 NADH-quinone oxidoreductase subunit NuoE [Armatimonadota bacterium]MDR7433568.1 NADH-quinone oxidoreductase subunit NuoE [Armatimonadota bacterium]
MMDRERRLSEKAREEIRRLQGLYPQARSALLPALFVAQGEEGYLSEEALEEVAELFDLPLSEVASVASFYTLFHRRPVGRHVIHFCTNLSCMLNGAEEILAHLCRRLGIQPGETTRDGLFTVKKAECLAACDIAPMMLVDEEVYGNLTPQKVDEILGKYREEGSG